jgi:hypothetical protein
LHEGSSLKNLIEQTPTERNGIEEGSNLRMLPGTLLFQLILATSGRHGKVSGNVRGHYGACMALGLAIGNQGGDAVVMSDEIY